MEIAGYTARSIEILDVGVLLLGAQWRSARASARSSSSSAGGTGWWPMTSCSSAPSRSAVVEAPGRRGPKRILIGHVARAHPPLHGDPRARPDSHSGSVWGRGSVSVETRPHRPRVSSWRSGREGAEYERLGLDQGERRPWRAFRVPQDRYCPVRRGRKHGDPDRGGRARDLLASGVARATTPPAASTPGCGRGRHGMTDARCCGRWRPPRS